MTKSEAKLFTLPSQAIILVLTVLTFAFFVWILPPFVPFDPGFWANFGLIATAACVTGVFFLGYEMFTYVLLDQRHRAKQQR